MNSSKWIRCTKQLHCPICDRDHYCVVSDDGAVAICTKIESSKRCGEAGWLHRLSDPIKYERPKYVKKPKPVVTDMSGYARECVKRLGSPSNLARQLGVHARALVRLSAGWNGSAYTFPMCDADRNVIGIRLRTKEGKKFAVKGSRNGMFLPDRLSDQGEWLLVCEGPSDTAALLGLGFDVIGRPSNTAAEDMLVSFINRRRPMLTAVIADRDKQGSDAERLTTKAARSLAARIKGETRIVRPPQKDSRDWVRSGATEGDVLVAIATARAI